ncbi:CBS domain-containing protein [Candidatus Thorarchaeota archaeon]|jgi:CBS domain-containing protein|nr:CBS domain-containing protein [Candidatus Thorarchaeota archaeon]TFG99162.1 MAG: CBS domain-containing protein [Candidatus Thorarchaeota archaeon]
MQVSQIMIEPVTIDKDQRLSYALELLNKKGIERLVVVQDGIVTGILTYADIADRLGVSKVVALSIKRLHVSSAMTDTVITVGPDDEVTDVAQLMIDRGMSGCPVVDADDKLVGIITKFQIVKLVDRFDKIKVSELMTKEDILQVNPVTRLVKARGDMLAAGYSGLPVTDGGRVLGLITERMVADAMARFTVEVPDKHRANQVRQIRVVDAMMQQPPLVTPEDSIADAATKMLEANLNTLPVVEKGNRLVGMIGATDLTRFVANKFKV